MSEEIENLKHQITRLRQALTYVSSPTMGLPATREAEEFVRSGDVDHDRAIYALECCIRTAKAALHG